MTLFNQQLVVHTQPSPWLASQSGITRTQIIKTNYATTSAAIIHTVTAGKDLFISSASIILHTEVSADASILVRNTSDVEVYRFLLVSIHDHGHIALSCPFPMPLVVPAGYDVCIVSSAAYADGCIQGWEE